MTTKQQGTEVLNELTADQDQLLEEIAEEYIADLTKPTKPNTKIINRWLDIAYGLFDSKRPDRVEIVASPLAALKLASELTGSTQDTTDDCGIGDGGWVSFYDYFNRVGVLPSEDEETKQLFALRDFSRVAWDTVLLDECAIVIRRPKTLAVDDSGSLHCADGPCIEWANGEKEFAWHGTWVSARIILEPKSFTKEEYLAITNTEERRALSEILGWSRVAEMLGAESIDKWTDKHTDLVYDLLRCADGTKLLIKQSPELKQGAQPTYSEPVHEDLKTAQAARKWQATRLTVDECERDPTLTYGDEA